MEYKGYVAAGELDDSGPLHGRAVNSGPYPIATFERSTWTGFRREFQRSNDDYLASCRGRPEEPLLGHPQPPARPRPAPTRRVVRWRAGISLNSWIEQAVEEKPSR